MPKPLPFAIFDMDGTLLDSMGLWDQVTGALLDGCARPVPKAERTRIVALTLQDAVELLTRDYGLPGPAAAVTERVRRQVRRMYAEQAALKPGAAEALAALARQGVAMCVASSTDKDQIDAALRAHGVLERFRFTLCCPDGHGKDEPAVYRQAMARLGARDPARVMVFEDSPVALATAKAAGFRVTAVRDAANEAHWAGMTRLADAVCESWPDWLRRQNFDA